MSNNPQPPPLEYQPQPDTWPERQSIADDLRRAAAFLFMEALVVGPLLLVGAIRRLTSFGPDRRNLLYLAIALFILLAPLAVALGSALVAPRLEQKENPQLAPAFFFLYAHLGLFLLASPWLIHAGCFLVLFVLQILLLLRATIMLHRVCSAPDSLLRNRQQTPDEPLRDLPPAHPLTTLSWEFDNLDKLFASTRTRYSWRRTNLRRTFAAALLFLLCAPLSLFITLEAWPHLDPCASAATLLLALLALRAIPPLWRGGCILDTAAQQLLSWNGPLVPLFIQRIPLSHITSLTLSRGKFPRNTNDTFCHLAAHTTLGPPILLRTFDYKPQAQRLGPRLAALLNTSFHDATLPQSNR